ncbi:MAG: serine/threonine protein kinase [Bradymonadaceae bacterium]
MSDTPRKLGRYELVRRIAVGGMGEIYLARVSGTGGFEKTVIIKTILPHLAEEDEFVEKFLDEGRIVVNLTHGNIVPVFDMDEVDGEYFIAMDYVPGRDVREILKRLRERGEQMPPEIAAYIIAEVCEGLGYAHRKTDDEGEPLDIVHRDVSPSNVLISTEGEVKIIDFGIARAADRRAKTVTGRIQGKCCYMSPEQARGDELDHRSDIFSTGVVFYEMLTGVRPFEGDSDLKSLDLVRECDYEPPSFVDGSVPPRLDGIIDRALGETPDERYQRIEEMHVELMEFLADDGPPVTSTDVASFLEELFPEGLEREEFQEVVDEEETGSEGAMDLEEALNHQLDQIGGESAGDGGASPLEDTQPRTPGSNGGAGGPRR